MKTNHRRKQPENESFDYGYRVFQTRWRMGLGMDHEHGRRGHAKDVKDAKTYYRRQRRRKLNNEKLVYMD